MTFLDDDERTDQMMKLAENVAALLDVAMVNGMSVMETSGVLAVLLYAGIEANPEDELVVRLQGTNEGAVKQVHIRVRPRPIEA